MYFVRYFSLEEPRKRRVCPAFAALASSALQYAYSFLYIKVSVLLLRMASETMHFVHQHEPGDETHQVGIENVGATELVLCVEETLFHSFILGIHTSRKDTRK